MDYDLTIEGSQSHYDRASWPLLDEVVTQKEILSTSWVPWAKFTSSERSPSMSLRGGTCHP